jgi:hypothetical protein
MISLKVLSTAAAMALVLPMLAPGASFGQNQHAGRPNVARGGGAGVHPGIMAATPAAIGAVVVVVAASSPARSPGR